jgi:hypothetical protein
MAIHSDPLLLPAQGGAEEPLFNNQPERTMKDTPKLVILDGQIFVKKDQFLFGSPKDYLTNWQSKNNHPNGTQVRVLTEDYFQDLIARSTTNPNEL